MRNYRKVLLKYSITTVAAGLLTLLTLHLHKFWEAEALVDQYKILADAFTIPGVLLVMLAALIWVSSEGFFDGLSYAARQFSSMLFPRFGKGRKYQHQTYYDYKLSKEGKRIHGYSFLFFVGLVFVAVAVVFILLHDSVYIPMA